MMSKSWRSSERSGGTITSSQGEQKMKTILFLSLILSATTAFAADETLPTQWKHQDLGTPTVPGSAAQADGVFTLQGTKDIWFAADGCQFMSQPAHGDFELVARVTAIDNPGGVAHAKASLCCRESLDPGSRQITVCVTAADGTQFTFRDKADDKSTHYVAAADAPKSVIPKAQFPCWLKLVRHGNDFSGYESLDGETWVATGQVTMDLPADTSIGLAASSHKPDVLTKDTFDHVKVSAGPTTAPSKP
jgi:hypothetical protein